MVMVMYEAHVSSDSTITESKGYITKSVYVIIENFEDNIEI